MRRCPHCNRMLVDNIIAMSVHFINMHPDLILSTMFGTSSEKSNGSTIIDAEFVYVKKEEKRKAIKQSKTR